jgi:predicted N-acyltransferase
MRMNLTVKMAHRVADIGEEAWDRLGAGHPFASYRWYRYGESVLENDTPLYILVSYHGETIARATFWLTRDEPLPLPSNVARTLMEAAFRRWPLLLCRVPFASRSGLVLPEDETLREAALQIITDRAQEFSRQQGASFLIYDYLESAEIHLPNFAQYEMPDAGTALLLSWSSFEDYVKQLGKSARKDYNRHCNRAQDFGIEVKTHRRVTDLDDALALIQNVERHHGTPPNPRTRQALENVHMVNAAWLTATFDGRLVGCGVLLGDGNTRALAFLGLDYNVQYVYFQMMYAAIRCAIESGVRVLWGGSGAYEFKERLGFQPVSNNQIVFAATNRIIGRAVRYLVAS